MENKKILTLKRNFVSYHYDNPFYTNQLGDDVNPNDVVFIDVTSKNKDKEFIKEISPFFIGPVITSEGKVCKNFENFWQFSKVFGGDVIFNKLITRRQKEEIPVVLADKDGNPTNKWFELRDFGFNEELAYRHPYTGKTLYFYHVEDGKVCKLDYIESRKKIYIKEYAKLVANTAAFKKLKDLVDSGKTIALIEYDAYNYYNKKYMRNIYNNKLKKYTKLSYDSCDFVSINCMKDAVNFPYEIVGQAFVLKMLLQNDIEVVNGEVIDHAGVLD